MRDLSFNTGSIRRVIAGCLSGFLLLSVVVLALPQSAYARETVIRVGYTDAGGVMADGDGNYSGFVVEYLEEIAKYTDWEYEYVQGSLAECAEMLRNGELDLMGLVRYTDTRADTFLYSELSMADDYTALCATAESDFYYQDYEAFNGSRIAVVPGSIYEKTFSDYARTHGLNCEIVYFTTEKEAERALLAGGVDLFVTGGLSPYTNLKVVDRFALERTYLVTGKQNEALMAELDAAIQRARLEHPELSYELTEKYHLSGSFVTNLYLTREEQTYLDSVGPILVKGIAGRRPLGYMTEDGRFAGILPDYLDMLGTYSGLEFIYEPAEMVSLEENAAAMDEEGYVLLSVEQPLEDLALEPAIYKTDALFDTALAYVRRQGEYITKLDSHTFAVNSALRYVGDLLLETNAQSTVLFYDTSLECMESVLNGEAEMAILDEHVAAYLLQKPKFADNLIQVAGSNAYVDSMCLYAPEAHQLLVSILNKTLAYLSDAQRLNTVAHAMITHSYEYELEDFLYEYGGWIGLSAALLAVIVVLGMLLITKIAKARQQKMENEALQEKIQLDELTGVYNRIHFFQRAREMIDQSEAEICIVRLNVCHFKLVNEIYGVEKGDYLLCEMGRDLKAMGQQMGFLVGRFTADHFYLCIRREDFERIGFPRRSSAPWIGMDITLSFGVYPVGEQKDIPVSAMCDRADLANASNEQSATEHICYYSDSARQRLLQDQEIENDMEQAISQRQFCIYIQPKYDITTEEIVGGEALVRWMHPQKGMIPPGTFIGLFERNGFIRQLDYYVWEECCRFLAEAKRKGLPIHPLSTNVSRIHFYGSELVDKLTGLIRQYGLEAGDLELEITESVCSDDPDIIFSICDELRETGFKIAMDDFGSGYSSLNMLKEMPLDIIKMDLRFLSGDTDAAQMEKGRNILRTLIELAHTLELRVVVEGLETADQKAFVQRVGNCVAQGYYYSRPVDCRSYESMIAPPPSA